MSTPNPSTPNPAIVLQRPQLQLRDTVPEPPAPDTFGRTNPPILFRHPGYPDRLNQNVFLRLDAFDSNTRALHHRTAKIACAIVACNAFEGYLTTSRQGAPLTLAEDDLLTESDYYFCVRNMDRYPIYGSFDDWMFPHDHFPSFWVLPEATAAGRATIEEVAVPATPYLSQAVLDRDRRCLVSKYGDFLEKAHICPVVEADWFVKNNMGTDLKNHELVGTNKVNDLSNLIALRGDIHCAFDSRKWVLVPKCSKWTVHFLSHTVHLGPMFHNTPVTLPQDISPKFLLARFAWAIFPRVVDFLVGATTPRQVKVPSTREEGEEIQDLSAKAAKRRFTGKRKAQDTADTQQPMEDEAGVPRSDSSPSLAFHNDDHHHARPLPIEAEDPDETAVPGPDDQAPASSPPKPYARYIQRLSPFDEMRLKRLLDGRPKNPALYHCNYDEIDRYNERERRKGSDHQRLPCWRCLGVEYLSDREREFAASSPE